MLASTTRAPFFVRLAAPLAWRNPGKVSGKLRGFAATELGSARDMMLAAETTSDPKLRRLFFRHAIDEYRHSTMFDAAAKKVCGGVAVRRYEALHAAPQNLLARWGEMRFVAFVHISETQAAARFEVLRDHFVDHDLGRLFDEILADEKFHCRYSEHLLDSWREAGRGKEVDKAVSAVKRSLLWMAWRRAGRRIGDVLVTGLMATLYFTVVPIFALLTRLIERRATNGWHTPKAIAQQPKKARLAQARRPY